MLWWTVLKEDGGVNRRFAVVDICVDIVVMILGVGVIVIVLRH